MAPSVSSHKRIKNISISKPIIYGNIAIKFSPSNPMPPDASKDHTHSWTIFVKDPTGNDLSTYVKKVVFKLHDTYNNSTRSIESPPFEITETGWGEFEILIKIFFHNDGGEKNLTLVHHLKLHPYNGLVSTDGKVESIKYEEIVFNEPTEKMFELLTQVPGTYLTDADKKKEREELDRINKSLKDIQSQVDKAATEFKNLEKERQELIQS